MERIDFEIDDFMNNCDYKILNNSQKTIVLCENTVTQLKNETINI